MGNPKRTLTQNKYSCADADPQYHIDPSGRFSLLSFSRAAAVLSAIGSVASTGNLISAARQSRAHGKGSYYHEYTTDQLTICTKHEVSWCNLEEVWMWMRHIPAPRFINSSYLANPLETTDKTCCIGGAFPWTPGGQIQVEVDKYFVNNNTTFWHALAYGKVERKAVQKGSRIVIDTLGSGENRSAFIAFMNDTVGPVVFNGLDKSIRAQILEGKAPGR